MKLSRTVLFLLVCLRAWSAERTIAQFVHKAWVGKDGAPANIMSIAQTNDGYLWLASSQGLYRFDGVEFERYEPPGQPPAPASVFALLSCRNGDLWVGSREAGVSLVRSGTIRNYTVADGVPNGGVFSLAQDREGRIWAATQGGLARFDGAKWRTAGTESGFAGLPIALYVDRHGTLWAAASDTIFFLPPGASTFQRTGLSTLWATHLLESPDGTMWMAESSRSAVRPVPPSGNTRQVAVGSRQILFDRDGSLWVTSMGDGLRRMRHPDRGPQGKLEDSSGEIESFTAAGGLSADYSTSVYEDREGNIWVGTAGGLDRFTKGAIVPAPVPGKFSLSTMAPGEDGDVWVGCLSKDVGKVHANQWVPGSTPFTAFSVVPDPKVGSWWATFNWGYREIGGRFSRFEFPGAYAANDLAARIALDRSGALWLAGKFGISVRNGGEWKSIDFPSGFPGKGANVAYADPTGRVWFGYRENSILTVDGTAIRAFSEGDGLKAGVVQAIYAKGSWTWIGGSRGLQLFDGRHFRDIGAAVGSAFGGVSGIIETSEGSLWLSASRGIVRIPPAAVAKVKAGASSAEYSLYDAYDGLRGVTQQAQPYPTLIQASDGKLWFGASNGPVWIDPHDLPRNELKPPLAIRSITANGKRYAPTAISRLPARTRDLEISYTALSFRVPERVRFRYRLEGSDMGWQEAGTRRQAFYTNLGPGDYRFRVMACNDSGVWNEDGAAVSFRIDPAYYQTIWFQAAAYAAGLALLWLLYRLRLQQATAQVHSRLEGQIAERERIARDLHDTLLQSFQGLMLHLEVVNELLPRGKAKTELEKSLGRADRAIAEGRSTVYDLRSSAIATSDLAESIKAIGDDLSTEGTATFRLVVEGAPRVLHPMIRDELYRIACEALRNAFRHARAHHIETEITYGERALRLRIRDDGEGIPVDILDGGRPGHYGLRGMRERTRQIGGKLEIWSGAKAGTEIDLSIAAPIAYAASRGESLFRRVFGKKEE